MTTVTIRLGSPALKRDPAPALERLRAAGPLARARMPLVGPVRLTTSHAAAEELLKDRERFVSNPATAGLDARPLPGWLPKRFQLLAKNIVLYDEPDHRRLRGRIDHAFARRGLAELRPALEAEADKLIAALDPGGFELVDGLARPLPLAAISALLGLPEGERDLFERLAGPLSGGGSTLSLLLGIWRLGGLLDDLRARIAAARAGDARLAHPDGLLAALAAPREGEIGRGGEIDDDELLAMILTLLVAGHETTTHLIAGGVWALLTHPEQLQRLRSGEVSIEDAVEELMRWLSPVMVTKPRYSAGDTTIGGAEIKRGEKAMACLLAANHDPARWEEPERLDLGRKPAGHLGFGAGIHFCVGLNLARLEAQIALSRLLARFPKLRLEGEPVWNKRPGLRGMARLRLRGTEVGRL